MPRSAAIVCKHLNAIREEKGVCFEKEKAY
jgi:hypothetical protein